MYEKKWEFSTVLFKEAPGALDYWIPCHPFDFSHASKKGFLIPPAVINRKDFFFENMLRHDAIKHRRDAVNGHVRVAHPQDAVKLGEDEGHGWQRGGLSEDLDDRNAPNLQGRRGKNRQRSVGTCFMFTPAAEASNSPQLHLRSEIPEHFLRHTEWKSPFRSRCGFVI